MRRFASRRRRITALSIAAGITSAFSGARAQASDTTTVSPSLAAWATLSIGGGLASNRSLARLGAQLGGAVSYDRWMVLYRRGGAESIENGGSWDDAILVGRRSLQDRSTVYVAVGPSRIHNDPTGETHIAFAFAAEAGANARVLGFGASVFGAVHPKLSFIGAGLTVDAGWVR